MTTALRLLGALLKKLHKMNIKRKVASVRLQNYSTLALPGATYADPADLKGY
jgi:hypothetical protein